MCRQGSQKGYIGESDKNDKMMTVYEEMVAELSANQNIPNINAEQETCRQDARPCFPQLETSCQRA